MLFRSGAIAVGDLAEVVVGGCRRRDAKKRLVPLEAGMHIANPNDGP